jgi:hypothetical protein
MARPPSYDPEWSPRDVLYPALVGAAFVLLNWLIVGCR